MKNPQIFDYQEVESSNIKAIGYNPSFDILSIVFHKDGITKDEYWYFEVPPLTFADFLEAESMGKFLHTQIKNRFRYLKVTFFEQDVLIDAIEYLIRQNTNAGYISSPFSVICNKHGLNFEDTWDKVMGRREWYQYQPMEYKSKVRQKASEIELHETLGY